jgi:hypothetical protein
MFGKSQRLKTVIDRLTEIGTRGDDSFASKAVLLVTTDCSNKSKAFGGFSSRT